MPVVKQIPTAPLPGVRRSPQRIAQIDAPLLKVQPPPDAFGTQLGETVAKVGEHFLGQFMEERKKATDRANEINANNAITGTMTDAQTVIAAALQKQGMEAAGVPEQALSEIDKVSDERRTKLINEDQRFLYDREYQARRVQYHGRLMEHAAVEVAKADDQSTQAKLGANKNDALLNAKDPNAVEWNIAQGEAEIDKSAAARLGTVSTKAAKDAYRSSIQRGAIQMLLNQGNDLDAQKRLDDVRSQLNAADLAAVLPALEEGSIRGESQRQADQIIKTATTEKEAVDAAQKIANPKVRDETQSRVEHAWQQKDQMDRRQQEANAQASAQAVEQMMIGLANVIDVKKGTDAIPPAIWESLSIPMRNSLDAYAKRLAKDGKIETEWDHYYNLMKEATSDPKTFEGRNLVLSRPKLADAEFKQLVELQMQVRKGNKEKAEPILNDARTQQQIIDNTLRSFGLDPTPKEGTPQATAIGQFRNMVGAEIQRRQVATKQKEMSNPEIKKVVDELIGTQITQPQGVLGTLINMIGAPVGFKLTPTVKRLMDTQIADVPADERTKIENVLKADGVPINDPNVLEFYIRTKVIENQQKPK